MYCKGRPLANLATRGVPTSMSASKTIYADYQATTPVDPRVLEKMAPYWTERFGNPHSSDHVMGWKAAEVVRESASSVAELIGADADEIVFTSGATEANNLALFGLARRAPASRRRILVSAIEHKCVLAAARALEEREGLTVEIIPVDREGFVDLEALKGMLDESVLVASIMAINNEIGTMQDIPVIASILARDGTLFHCDAAQAPCAMDVSELAEHADLISLSGHKLYGPQGIGALYIRRDIQERIEPIIYGGGQQDGLRSGTVPVPLCVGMSTASDILKTKKVLKSAVGSPSIAIGLLNCCRIVRFQWLLTARRPIVDIPVTSTFSSEAFLRRIYSARFSLGWRLPLGPRALPVFLSLPMSYVPLVSVKLRLILPSGSALGGLRPMMK